MWSFHGYQERSPVGPAGGGVTLRKMAGRLIWPAGSPRRQGLTSTNQSGPCAFCVFTLSPLPAVVKVIDK